MKNLAAILGVGVGGYLLWKMSKPKKVKGCTDSTASNYNELATDDDGTCTYPNVTPPMGDEGMEFGGSGGKGSSTSSGNTGMGGGDPYDDSEIYTKIATMENEIDANTSKANNNEVSLGTKADAADLTSVSDLVGTKADASAITTLESQLGNKADASAITNLESQLGNKADASAITTLESQLGNKADSSSVVSLGTDLETFSAKADANESDLADFSMAATTFYNDQDIANAAFDTDIALNTTNIGSNATNIGTNTTNIGTNTTNIGTKADSTYVDTQVSDLQSAVDTQVSGLQSQIDNAFLVEEEATGAFFSGGSRQRRSGFIPNAW